MSALDHTPQREDGSRITVRDFAPGDEARCIVIFARAWDHAFPHLRRRFDRDVFAGETQGETILVACDETSTVLGFSSLYRPESFIHHLFVDPAFHRRGAGAALLAATVALAGGAATLKCQISNRRALAFYRSLGWREIEEGGDVPQRWVRLGSPPPAR